MNKKVFSRIVLVFLVALNIPFFTLGCLARLVYHMGLFGWELTEGILYDLREMSAGRK